MSAQGDIVFVVGADVTGLTRAGQSGEQSLADMERAAKTLERQIGKIGEAGVSFQREMNKLTGVTRDVAKSARDSAAAFEAFEKSRAQVDNLRASIDPLYAASRRYEQALGQLDTALEQGAISAREHAAMMDQLAAAYLRADGAAEQMGGGLGMLGGMSSQTQGKLQQIGFQVQDFAVQVGAGTSAAQAFAQQFPQMAMAFGPWGAAVGTAAAILVPLGAAFFAASQQADNLTAAADRQKAVMEGLVSVYTRLRQERDMLNSGAQTSEEQAALNEINRLAMERVGLERELNDLHQAANDALGVINTTELERLNTALATNEANRKAQEALLDAIQKERARLEAAKTAKDLAEQMRGILTQLAAADISSPWRNVLGHIQSAINKAAEYARKSQFGMSTGDASWAQNSLGFLLPGSDLLPPAATGSGGGGGGGGRADPMQARIDQLLQSLKTQDQIVAEWYAASLETLNAASDAQLEAIGGRHTAIERLEEEHQKRLAGIRDMGNQWGLQAALEGGAQILGAMGSMNKQALKAQAVFASAAALIDTYRGAAAEIKNGTIGFAKAAAVISRGIGFVSAIKNAASSGGAGGGGASASSAAAAASPMPASVNLTWNGPITANSFKSLTEQLNSEFKQGYRLNYVGA